MNPDEYSLNYSKREMDQMRGHDPAEYDLPRIDDLPDDDIRPIPKKIDPKKNRRGKSKSGKRSSIRSFFI